jgi:indole-3-pyruvate monooxygenase
MARPNHTNTLIIGGSAAGLSCAACLQKSGIPFILLEQNENPGKAWKKRYDRLHLHTTKKHSHLPFLKMPSHYTKYVSKDDFAKYLDDYAAAFSIRPHFNEKVKTVEQKQDRWIASTDRETYSSENIIIATGLAGEPVGNVVNGINKFKGKVLHSSEYANGKLFKNKKVLIVGFGNSACEIALCLHEHQALPSLSVRHGVNILPREIAGISVVNIALLQSWIIKFSPALADRINKPVLRFINGDIKKYGLKECGYGPLTQIMKDRKIPLLDIGTLALIKTGKIKVFPGIADIVSDMVKFTDGSEENPEVIICATGYRPSFGRFLKNFEKVCDDQGIPLASGKESALSGLFFCGFHVSATGMLREIGIEAKRIAGIIKRKHFPVNPFTDETENYHHQRC